MQTTYKLIMLVPFFMMNVQAEITKNTDAQKIAELCTTDIDSYCGDCCHNYQFESESGESSCQRECELRRRSLNLPEVSALKSRFKSFNVPEIRVGKKP